ncbi:hypothetical protein [Flavobacterium orientale]|uniref:Uncharacterized protein n=1 Tax=Flavobacterium orientale TaxID=1756020 RepID=A0A916Y367_9FLAO|nr:hypothetical protein [Flavobacterium orientale]GGD28881.1 hypothetical protein GCM10011343_18790 [Flavobacterium orientale]
MNTNEITNLIKSIQIKENEIQLMKQLATAKGFIQYYFSHLKSSATKEDAFSKVNELYLQYFGETRFSNYLEFKQTLKVIYSM